MQRNFFTAAFVVSAVFMLSGCDLSFLSSGKTSQQPAAVSLESMPIDGDVLAQVGQWRIGAGDFQKMIADLKNTELAQTMDLDSKETRGEFLDNMIDQAVLAEEARRQGLDRDPEVKRQMMEAQYGVLAQRLAQTELDKLEVTDQDVENFYNLNPQQFTSYEQIKIREMAVATDPAARDILKRLLDGESFAALAQQQSILDTKGKGGDVGFVIPVPTEDGGITGAQVGEDGTAQEVKRFNRYWETVLTMRKGDDPRKVQGDDGNFYILSVVDNKPSEKAPLDDQLKDRIRQQLLVEKRTEALKRLQENARLKIEVIQNRDLL